MGDKLAEEIIKEGVNVLYSHLGAVKAVKFLQLISIGIGDSVKEIEKKTEQMSKNEVMALIAKMREERPALWKSVGLL